MKIMVTLRILYLGDLGKFDEQTDQLMDALLELDGVIDPDIAASLSEGLVDVTMIVDVEDFDAASAAALSAVRTAIHAIGGWTPGWNGQIREAKVLTDA